MRAEIRYFMINYRLAYIFINRFIIIYKFY